jgi:uncharacterized membrane protein YgcG
MTTMTTTDPTAPVDEAPYAVALLQEPATPAPRPPVERPAPKLTTRPMPPLVHGEPTGYRLAWLAVGLMVTALFAVVVFRFYAPADAGVDQNAYLVGGRLIAQNFSTKYVLPHPFAYTGGMFVRMPTDPAHLEEDNPQLFKRLEAMYTHGVPRQVGVYYPKYPAGLPLLYAIFFWIFGPDKGPVYAFVVSPASAVLAVLGTFYLARAVAGSFAAVMAAVLLGTSQVMLSLADNPNSHASATACIIWGMFLLVRWWQTGRIWQGALAGFLIGYAFTIRYTEVLLALPVGIACLTRLRWRHWTPWVLSSAVAAMGVAFMLFVSLWTNGDADGLRGYHYWFSAGRTGLTSAMLSAYVYAGCGVPAFVALAFGLQKRAGWSAFLERIGWPAWRGRAYGAAVAAVALAAVWPLLNVLWFAPTLAAVLDGAQWIGPGKTLWTALSLALLGGATLVGMWSSLAAGTHRAWVLAFVRGIVPGLAWAVPVVLLVAYNSGTMRHAFGYDTTNESKFGVAFKWSFFVKNWEMVVRTFDDLELFFVVPFAIAGLALVFRRSWRVGVLLLAWLIPGVALYTSYYWSMNFDVAYARFYLTFLPALCVGAAVAFHDGVLGGRVGGTGEAGPLRHWGPIVQVAAATAFTAAVVLAIRLWMSPDWEYLHGLAHWIGPGKSNTLATASALAGGAVLAAVVVAVAAYRGSSFPPGRLAALAGRVPATVAVGLVVAVSSGVSAYRAIHGLRDGSESIIPLVENFRSRLNLAQVGQALLGQHAVGHAGPDRHLVDNVPAGSVLFSMAGGGIQSPTNYTQFLRDWDVFPSDAFSAEGSRRGFGGGGANNRNRRNGNGNGNGNRPGFNGGGGPPGGGGPGGAMGGGPGGGPPGAGGNTNDNDDQDTLVATPVQPEQQEYHASLYRGLNARQLWQRQLDVVHTAFKNHRQVFVIVGNQSGLDTLETFEDGLDEYSRATADKFDFKTVAAWKDVALPVDPDDESTANDRNRWGGGGAGRGGNNRRGGPGGAGMMGGMGRLMGLVDQQYDWKLVEILPASGR